MQTILILHKDPDTSESLKNILETNGYKAIIATSSQDFLKKANSKIDLILIDGLMPKEKVLKIAKEKKIKYLFFSSEYLNVDEESLYKNVILTSSKSFDINNFLKKIKSILKK